MINYAMLCFMCVFGFTNNIAFAANVALYAHRTYLPGNCFGMSICLQETADFTDSRANSILYRNGAKVPPRSLFCIQKQESAWVDKDKDPAYFWEQYVL